MLTKGNAVIFENNHLRYRAIGNKEDKKCIPPIAYEVIEYYEDEKHLKHYILQPVGVDGDQIDVKQQIFLQSDKWRYT